MAIITEAM